MDFNRESLTRAYLKGKDAESVEVQEHAHSSSPGAVRIGTKNITTGGSWLERDLPFSCLGRWFPSRP
jgi:hypothetical protein